jgi:SAM-dependent methyltransferase
VARVADAWSRLKDRYRENRWVMWAVRHRPGYRIFWGSLRRTEPFSRSFGRDRGLPVDRVYIEDFLSRNRADICGRVLEIQSANYAHRFGGELVRFTTVVDIDATNPDATLVADLCEAGSLPPAAFDCFIMTQTLQLLPDPRSALTNAWSALVRGGSLLITVPALSRLSRCSPDYWRFTPAGLARFLADTLPEAEVSTIGYGNVLSGVAFLFGFAAGELTDEELSVCDDAFPVLVAARVHRACAIEAA